MATKLSGSFRGLFVHLFAILLPFSFWKVWSIRLLLLLRFSFSYFLPWRPEHGPYCRSQNSFIFCWFHPSSSWRGAKKRMKMEKSMDAEWISTTAVRLILSPSREGNKKKRCWKIIFVASAFYEKERTNFENKKCPVEVKGHGVSPLVQRKIFFMADFSQQKKQRPTVIWSM